MARKYRKKSYEEMDEATRKLLGSRLMTFIVEKMEGKDDREQRVNAEKFTGLEVGWKESPYGQDGSGGRRPGTNAQDILTGRWPLSESQIEVLLIKAAMLGPIPNDLFTPYITAVFRSFGPYQSAVAEFKDRVSKLMEPLLKEAGKTKQPAYARGLLADALRALIPEDAQDSLNMPEGWVLDDDESRPGSRYYVIEEMAQAGLRPVKRRKKRTVKR